MSDSASSMVCIHPIWINSTVPTRSLLSPPMKLRPLNSLAGPFHRFEGHYFPCRRNFEDPPIRLRHSPFQLIPMANSRSPRSTTSAALESYCPNCYQLPPQLLHFRICGAATPPLLRQPPSLTWEREWGRESPAASNRRRPTVYS